MLEDSLTVRKEEEVFLGSEVEWHDMGSDEWDKLIDRIGEGRRFFGKRR
jgi:hypothetical protein